LQIIIVNDGSPDSSPAICEEYARRDSRIAVINKKNGGLSDARNAGIEQANGEYIALIDSDDYINKRYIENMYNCIKRDNSDMCICDFIFVNEGEEDLNRITSEPVYTHTIEKLSGMSYSADILMGAVSNTPYVVAWNKLYHRKLFDNIKYPVGRLHEDEFVLHRLFTACKFVSLLPEQLYFYLQRAESIVGRPYSARRLDILDAYEDRINFYIENKNYDLLKCTFLGYIRRYVEADAKLPVNVEENKVRWKECAAKFRAHRENMFKYGGFGMGMRFRLACASPKLYRAMSGGAGKNKI
jgi:glycosyltransferase involved in cell wall biosynthesis